MWTAPTPDEKARLLGEHAHRFPLPVRVPVIGDRGARLQLSFLLGNPSGSVRTANGATSPAFSKIVGMITLGKSDEGDDDELIRDCVLWPGPREIASARNRWPGLVADISKQVARKIGLTDPPMEIFPGEAQDEKTAPLADVMAAHPRAILRRFSPPGHDGKPFPFILVIDTPERVRHDVFVDAINERGADRVKLAREFAEGTIVGADGASVEEVFDRWPGTMLVAVGVALKLAGAAESAHLGEW